MLILLRHGQTLVNAEARLQGRSDAPLTELGAMQASAAASYVGSVSRVVSSPLLRARQTAEAFNTDVTLDPRWLELDYGELDGRPLAEVPIELWNAWRADPEFRPPGGESLLDLGLRVRDACEELTEVARDENVVVVSHVSPIKAAVAWALGVGDEIAWRMFLDVASICRIAVGASGVSLVGFNDRSHLEGIHK